MLRRKSNGEYFLKQPSPKLSPSPPPQSKQMESGAKNQSQKSLHLRRFSNPSTRIKVNLQKHIDQKKNQNEGKTKKDHPRGSPLGKNFKRRKRKTKNANSITKYKILGLGGHQSPEMSFKQSSRLGIGSKLNPSQESFFLKPESPDQLNTDRVRSQAHQMYFAASKGYLTDWYESKENLNTGNLELTNRSYMSRGSKQPDEIKLSLKPASKKNFYKKNEPKIHQSSLEQNLEDLREGGPVFSLNKDRAQLFHQPSTSRSIFRNAGAGKSMIRCSSNPLINRIVKKATRGKIEKSQVLKDITKGLIPAPAKMAGLRKRHGSSDLNQIKVSRIESVEAHLKSQGSPWSLLEKSTKNVFQSKRSDQGFCSPSQATLSRYRPNERRETDTSKLSKSQSRLRINAKPSIPEPEVSFQRNLKTITTRREVRGTSPATTSVYRCWIQSSTKKPKTHEIATLFSRRENSSSSKAMKTLKSIHIRKKSPLARTEQPEIKTARKCRNTMQVASRIKKVIKINRMNTLDRSGGSVDRSDNRTLKHSTRVFSRTGRSQSPCSGLLKSNCFDKSGRFGFNFSRKVSVKKIKIRNHFGIQEQAVKGNHDENSVNLISTQKFERVSDKAFFKEKKKANNDDCAHKIKNDNPLEIDLLEKEKISFSTFGICPPLTDGRGPRPERIKAKLNMNMGSVNSKKVLFTRQKNFILRRRLIFIKSGPHGENNFSLNQYNHPDDRSSILLSLLYTKKEKKDSKTVVPRISFEAMNLGKNKENHQQSLTSNRLKESKRFETKRSNVKSSPKTSEVKDSPKNVEREIKLKNLSMSKHSQTSDKLYSKFCSNQQLQSIFQKQLSLAQAPSEMNKWPAVPNQIANEMAAARYYGVKMTETSHSQISFVTEENKKMSQSVVNETVERSNKHQNYSSEPRKGERFRSSNQGAKNGFQKGKDEIRLDYEIKEFSVGNEKVNDRETHLSEMGDQVPPRVTLTKEELQAELSKVGQLENRFNSATFSVSKSSPIPNKTQKTPQEEKSKEKDCEESPKQKNLMLQEKTFKFFSKDNETKLRVKCDQKKKKKSSEFEKNKNQSSKEVQKEEYLEQHRQEDVLIKQELIKSDIENLKKRTSLKQEFPRLPLQRSKSQNVSYTSAANRSKISNCSTFLMANSKIPVKFNDVDWSRIPAKHTHDRFKIQKQVFEQNRSKNLKIKDDLHYRSKSNKVLNFYLSGLQSRKNNSKEDPNESSWRNLTSRSPSQKEPLTFRSRLGEGKGSPENTAEAESYSLVVINQTYDFQTKIEKIAKRVRKEEQAGVRVGESGSITNQMSDPCMDVRLMTDSEKRNLQLESCLPSTVRSKGSGMNFRLVAKQPDDLFNIKNEEELVSSGITHNFVKKGLELMKKIKISKETTPSGLSPLQVEEGSQKVTLSSEQKEYQREAIMDKRESQSLKKEEDNEKNDLIGLMSQHEMVEVFLESSSANSLIDPLKKQIESESEQEFQLRELQELPHSINTESREESDTERSKYFEISKKSTIHQTATFHALITFMTQLQPQEDPLDDEDDDEIEEGGALSHWAEVKEASEADKENNLKMFVTPKNKLPDASHGIRNQQRNKYLKHQHTTGGKIKLYPGDAVDKFDLTTNKRQSRSAKNLSGFNLERNSRSNLSVSKNQVQALDAAQKSPKEVKKSVSREDCDLHALVRSGLWPAFHPLKSVVFSSNQKEINSKRIQSTSKRLRDSRRAWKQKKASIKQKGGLGKPAESSTIKVSDWELRVQSEAKNQAEVKSRQKTQFVERLVRGQGVLCDLENM